MPKYTISKYETLVSVVEIEAANEDEATRLADEQFNEGIPDQDIVNVWYETQVINERASVGQDIYAW